MDKHFIVATDSGIPFRNQEEMTREEAEEWIKHDIEECHKCGLNTISRQDYIIVDTDDWKPSFLTDKEE